MQAKPLLITSTSAGRQRSPRGHNKPVGTTKQHGFTLIGIALIIPIVAGMVFLIDSTLRAYSTQQEMRALGDTLATVELATRKYVRTNRALLRRALPVVGTVNGFAPTMAELLAGQHLPDYYSTVNLLNATPLVRIDRAPIGCELVNPDTCDVRWLVYFDRPLTGDDLLPNIRNAVTVARQVGVIGGYSDFGAGGTMTGASGTWTTANPTGLAGTIGAFNSLRQIGDDGETGTVIWKYVGNHPHGAVVPMPSCLATATPICFSSLVSVAMVGGLGGGGSNNTGSARTVATITGGTCTISIVDSNNVPITHPGGNPIAEVKAGCAT